MERGTAVSMTDSGGEEKHTRLTKENYTLSLLDESKPVQAAEALLKLPALSVFVFICLLLFLSFCTFVLSNQCTISQIKPKHNRAKHN